MSHDQATSFLVQCVYVVQARYCDGHYSHVCVSNVITTNMKTLNITLLLNYNVGRDISVGIATRYGLDGPGIESRWGVRFSAPVQSGPDANPASYTTGTWSFQEVKRPRSGVDHPPPSSP